jgi:hypothetical protein
LVKKGGFGLPCFFFVPGRTAGVKSNRAGAKKILLSFYGIATRRFGK